MRKFFAVLYVIYGGAFLSLMWWLSESVYAAWVTGAFAMLCFIAAWQGFFVGGLAWRIIHITLSLLAVAVCALAWGYVGSQLIDSRHGRDIGFGLLFVGPIAIASSIPAVASLISAAVWLRQRILRGTAGATPSNAAFSAAPAPVDARTTQMRAPASNLQPWIGAALLALGLVAIAAWARFGSELRCAGGSDTACFAAAHAAVQRDDRKAAVGFYDRVLAREFPRWHSDSKTVPAAWTERNAILVALKDYARIDAAADEACPKRPRLCSDLGQSLDNAGDRARAESVFRRLCESGGGEPCAEFGKWLIVRGDADAGLRILQSQCDMANIMACLEYGTQLAHGQQFDQARTALKRACVLQAEGNAKGSLPTPYAVCQNYLVQEKAFVSPVELRDDARELCFTYLRECADAAGVIASRANDPNAAREMVEQACARHGALAASRERICSATEGYMRRERTAR